jgi:hypothetical protein
MQRKAMGLNELPQTVIVFAVSFIVLAFGALIVTNVQTSLTAGPATNVTSNISSGLLSLGTYAPTIAIVVAGALIIGILVNSFMRQGV